MSIRTVIEINHDYLARLDDLVALQSLIDALRGSEFNRELNAGRRPEIAPGVKVITQRHHSTPCELHIKFTGIEIIKIIL